MTAPGVLRVALDMPLGRLFDYLPPPPLAADFAIEPGSLQELQSEQQSLEAAILAFEKSFLKKALKRNDWNRKLTAQQLGIGYSTMKAKLKSYGLVYEDDGDE